MQPNSESNALHNVGHFSSYETMEIRKTLANLEIDFNWQERSLEGIAKMEEICREYRIWHEFASAAVIAHERIGSRINYTAGLIADARGELSIRGENR